ncbi:polysaccharide deacetylase family protein [Telmatospirillum sp.]|uniref:polysaccharide deacetylase family protein n=1 Tax=Telmatospirillum sp. TaxID=2079197 RepID=UPI00283FE006|nr:polysaccharide deacetylase family protein [Telmatospirillum sp.]MDR3436539.1 polysaccharide deacetylase family protein [Telmatospirillum sp.]
MTKISWAGNWLPVLHRLPGHTNGRREVALTIDDGPTDVTAHLLKTLLSVNAKATFFLNGARLMGRSALVERILSEGHDVYAHGVLHVRLDDGTPARLRSDLIVSEAALTSFRPTPSPYLVRLPYAAGRRKSWVHRTIRDWRHDSQIAHWSLSAEDHTIAPQCDSRAEVEQLCAKAVAKLMAAPALDGSIILVHDVPHDVISPYLEAATVTLFEMLVMALTGAGYAIVALRGQPSPSPLSRFLLEK